MTTLRKVMDTIIDNNYNTVMSSGARVPKAASRSKRPAKIPPYRESILTYLLSSALGGTCCTRMLACISPLEDDLEDTLGTLRYALRAKAVKNFMCLPQIATLREATDRLRLILTPSAPDELNWQAEIEELIAQRRKYLEDGDTTNSSTDSD
jgi:hypothetical protein